MRGLGPWLAATVIAVSLVVSGCAAGGVPGSSSGSSDSSATVAATLATEPPVQVAAYYDLLRKGDYSAALALLPAQDRTGATPEKLARAEQAPLITNVSLGNAKVIAAQQGGEPPQGGMVVIAKVARANVPTETVRWVFARGPEGWTAYAKDVDRGD